MGLASLGFADGGPSLTFRIDPESLDIKVQVFSNVQTTVGGRVVQITGTQITDVVITGSLGEDRFRGPAAPGQPDHPGSSWRLAEEFFSMVSEMMTWQSYGSTQVGIRAQYNLRPATFVYSPLNLKFPCYVKSIVDPAGDGTSGVAHKVGRANYQYVLTLFPVQEKSGLQIAGTDANGVLDKAKASAIDAYIGRISQGIGWRFTAYNGGATASSPWDPSWQQSNPSATPKSNG